jgi:hypothetical protein
MKNNFLPLLLIIIAISAIGLLSCDKVKPPYVIREEVIDTAECPIPQFPALSNVNKKILIEDFTGHKCGNCPKAHIVLHDLILQYGDLIVPAAYHVSDFFASPDGSGYYTYEFRTNAGNEIDQSFIISDNGLPNGMINRTSYSGNIYIGQGDWQTVVQSMLNDTAKVALQIINDYDGDDSTFCTHIKITFLEDISYPVSFVCGLTEDSIIKPQKYYDQGLPQDCFQNYVHMHVFRGGINGTFGVTLNPEKTKKDSSIIKSYSYNLKNKDFVHKNLKVISYVFNYGNNEVMQVEGEKVIP